MIRMTSTIDAIDLLLNLFILFVVFILFLFLVYSLYFLVNHCFFWYPLKILFILPFLWPQSIKWVGSMYNKYRRIHSKISEAAYGSYDRVHAAFE